MEQSKPLKNQGPVKICKDYTFNVSAIKSYIFRKSQKRNTIEYGRDFI